MSFYRTVLVHVISKLNNGIEKGNNNHMEAAYIQADKHV